MKTFAQFITEKFYQGLDGPFGYAEIWVNPSAKELSAAMSGHEGVELGAVLTPENLYVWDRENATHDHVIARLKEPKSRMLPLYLFPKLRTKTIKVAVASFTMNQLGRYHYNTDTIIQHVANHPKLQSYQVIAGGDY